MAQPLTGFYLGRRPYLPVMELMGELFEARRYDRISDVVLLLEHESVITLGRGAHAENLLASEAQLAKLGVDVVETGRGGDVTLHAPGQLVAYPIIQLSPDRQDVRKYVQHLTAVMGELVEPEGIQGGTIDKMIGLWTDAAQPQTWRGQEHAQSPAKIGAIGVRISRWITAHGFALNLTTDLGLFSLIVPCGIQEHGVASVQSLTGRSPDVKDAARRALSALNVRLGTGSPAWVDASASPLSSILDQAH